MTTNQQHTTWAHGSPRFPSSARATPYHPSANPDQCGSRAHIQWRLCDGISASPPGNSLVSAVTGRTWSHSTDLFWSTAPAHHGWSACSVAGARHSNIRCASVPGATLSSKPRVCTKRSLRAEAQPAPDLPQTFCTGSSFFSPPKSPPKKEPTPSRRLTEGSSPGAFAAAVLAVFWWSRDCFPRACAWILAMAAWCSAVSVIE